MKQYMGKVALAEFFCTQYSSSYQCVILGCMDLCSFSHLE